MLLFHGLVLGYLLVESHILLPICIGLFGLYADLLLHSLQRIHQLLNLSLTIQLLIVFPSEQFNTLSEVIGQHARIMAVVLSSLVDLFGGKVLQVVDGFFYSFDALIHAFV